MNWVRTHYGNTVSLSSPEPEGIDIRDIACSLSRINRFLGATRLPVNVADHSLNVVRYLAHSKAPALVQLLGLLHDAHEAYIGDVIGPMRRELADWAGRDIVQRIADRFDQAIRKAFGLPVHIGVGTMAMIHVADEVILSAEWRDLMPGAPPVFAQPAPFAIKPRNADQSELAFLKAFDQLRLEVGPIVKSPASI